MVKNYLVFLGPPASGKGTQADMLGEKINIPVISPGELLRHERDIDSAMGKKVAERIEHGKLVEDEIISNLLDERLKKDDIKNGFVWDGFPRQESQLEYFDQKMGNLVGSDDYLRAIYINVSDETVKKRVGDRRVCDCGESYHLLNKPPQKVGVCDLCGAKIYQRKDDAPEVVEERLRGFHERIRAILDYFVKKNILVTIDGELSIKEVEEQILKRLNL